MLVSVYLCKNLNRKRAAAGSESAGDAVLPKEKCGASGKECGAKKRLLEKIPQGAGTFVAGAGGAGKRMRRTKEGGRCHAAEGKMRRVRQRVRAKNGCLRKFRKVPERFVAGIGGAGKRMR